MIATYTGTILADIHFTNKNSEVIMMNQKNEEISHITESTTTFSKGDRLKIEEDKDFISFYYFSEEDQKFNFSFKLVNSDEASHSIASIFKYMKMEDIKNERKQ